MSELPPPPVPLDCNLRDYKFIPLEIERLRRSRSWLIAKRRPELGFYMLNLWIASWHEVPAASLEDDDDVLADLAMCDPKNWPKVRDDVMRGWIKHSDGRIYHQVVVEKAIEAWERKRNQSKRGAAGALARWRKDASSMRVPMLADANRQGQGEERDKKERDKSLSKKAGDENFETFWRAYPRRADKGHARTAYGRALQKVAAEVILAAATAYAVTRLGQDPKFTALASTWLNGERWSDEAQPLRVVTPFGSPGFA